MQTRIAVEYVALAEENLEHHNDARTALRYLNRAIAIDPSNASAYQLRGRLYYYSFSDKNQPDAYKQKAIKDLQYALELEPEHEKALNSLTIIFRTQKDYSKAIEICEKVLKINPKNATANCIYGILLTEIPNFKSTIHDIPDALTAFNRAIEFNDKDSIFYIQRGREHFCLKNYSLALQDFLAACKFARSLRERESLQVNLNKYSKDDILDAIGKLANNEQILLLEQCIDKTTPLGHHLAAVSIINRSPNKAIKRLAELKKATPLISGTMPSHGYATKNYVFKDMTSALTHHLHNKNDLTKQITAILEKNSKEQILTVINSFLDPKEKLALLIECLDETTLLGKYMWKREGLIACSLEKGHLQMILNQITSFAADRITNFAADRNLPLSKETFGKTLGSINRIINKHPTLLHVRAILECARGLINIYLKEDGFALMDFISAASALPNNHSTTKLVEAFLKPLKRQEILDAIATLAKEDQILLLKKCINHHSPLGAHMLKSEDAFYASNATLVAVINKRIQELDPNYVPGLQVYSAFSKPATVEHATPTAQVIQSYENFSNSLL